MPNSLVPKKYAVALAGLFLFSLILNVYLLTASHLPIVTGGASTNETVYWYDKGRVGFSGVALSLEDKKSNLSDGYQYFAGEVRMRLSSNSQSEFSCQVTNSFVLGETVSIDEPFKAQDRECRVLQFDGNAKSAELAANGIKFSVVGQHVTWQDKSGSGPLVTAYDRMFHSEKFK